MTILLKAWLFSLVIIIFLSSRFLLTINSCYCRYSLFAFRLGPAGLIRLNNFWSTWVIFIIRCFLSPPSGWSKMFFFVFQLIINIRLLSYSRFPILLLIFVRICLDFTPPILFFRSSFFNIFSYLFHLMVAHSYLKSMYCGFHDHMYVGTLSIQCISLNLL